MKINLSIKPLAVALSVTLFGCGDEAPSAKPVTTEAAPVVARETTEASNPGAAPARTAQANESAPPKVLRTAGLIDFPAIPSIVVPEIIGVGEAQKAMENSLEELLADVDGITIKPARCAAGESLVSDSGVMGLAQDGTVSSVSDMGVFEMKPDGSGHAVIEGGVFSVNADGTGTIVRDDEVIEYLGDGKGSFVGGGLVIQLDGKGAGSFVGDAVIQNFGNGSGTYNGDFGVVEINADGTGSWVGDEGIIKNFGDGFGTIDSERVAMAPLQPVAPAPIFPAIARFVPKDPTCGIVITLDDRVLFDFDQSVLREDAAEVLENLAKALKTPAIAKASLEIRGHTDSVGSNEYNESLSQARAESVMKALQGEQVPQSASAEGFGENQPVAANERKDGSGKLVDDPAGRQRNRRVEIFVRT